MQGEEMRGDMSEASRPAEDRQPLPATMRAAQLMGPRQVRVSQVPMPTPGPDEVLVRLDGCGLCGSNLPVWQGRPWFTYPLDPGAPGHEGWGTVVALGASTGGPARASRPRPWPRPWSDAQDTPQEVRVGTRVALLAERAFAEYAVAGRDAVVPLPPALAGLDMPGEPLGCAMNMLRRSDIRPGHWVAVVGVGFLGALAIQLARRAGARVIAVSRRPFSLALARELGAEETFALARDHDGQDHDAHIVERVHALTAAPDDVGDPGCDRVIEAAGLQRPLDLATRLVRTRGRLIIAGFHQDGPRQVDVQTWNWRGIDVVNAHERDPRVYVEGIRAAVDAVQRGALDLAPVLTHRLALDRIDEAFRLLEDRPEGFVKAEVLM